MPAVTSGANGEFRISLAPGTYDVAIKGPPGYNDDKDRVHVRPGMPTQYFYLVHQPGPPVGPPVQESAILNVRVLASGAPSLQRPLQGARVQILRNNQLLASNTTNVQGRTSFTLDTGSYVIRTNHPGYATDQGNVMLKAGETTHAIYLRRTAPPVQDLASLTIQVGGTDPQGGNRVVLLQGASVVITQSGRQVAAGSTDSNGHFATRLKPGSYLVRATHPSYRVGQDKVTLSTGTVHRRILLSSGIQGQPVNRVTLNVQVGGADPKGGSKIKLVGGARVSITQNGRPSASGSTNKNGVFTTRLVPGNYQIRVSHGSYYPGSATVTLSASAVDRRILLRPRTQIK
jgi:hypothetical protein